MFMEQLVAGGWKLSRVCGGAGKWGIVGYIVLRSKGQNR